MVSINGLPSTSNEKDHSPSTSSASFRPKPVESQNVNTDKRSPQSPSILKRARVPSSASESEKTPPRVFPQLTFRSSIDNISTDERRVTSRKMPGLDDDQALREVKVGDAPYQDTDHSSKPHMSESSAPSFPTKPTAALPRPKTVFEEIKAFGNKQTKKGQTWYLVADSWYRRLEKFAATDAIATSVVNDDYTQHELYPGPVDNSTIVEVDDLTLKRGMLEGYDFHFLSEEGWKKLVSWFGIQNAWTPISLPVIVPGRFSVPIIEIYPPTFTLLRIAKEKAEPSSTTREYPPQITISRGATISDLHTKAAQALSVLPKNFRIWRLRESTEDLEPLLGSKSAITDEEFQTSIITVNDLKEKYDGELVQEPDDSLVGEAPFVADMFIAMEIADDNGNWIIEWNNPNANADGESSSTKEPKGKPFTMNTIVHDTDDEDELTSSHFDRLDKWANNDDDVLALTPSTVSQSTSQDSSFTEVSHIRSPAHRSIKPFQSMHTGSSLTTKIRENDSPKPIEVPKRKHPRGVTGLQNLGNTCFMNSALQCLSNTAKLTAYFMDGTYKKELNRTNPLGMNGEVAEVYGALVESLWSPTGSLSVNPREFKYTIARFAPFFTGYQQHDSQELLNFLLDGLHEDLNRIEKKPYIELKDSDGRPDDVVAKEVWEAHKARNDSVITDIFSGQFKSTLVCPECNIVSVTFDPFSTLSLPLPVAKKKKLDVIVVRTDINTRPLKLTLSLPKEATHRNMKEEIGRILTINPKKLASIETFGNKIYKIFDDKDAIAEIRDNDVIYVHELQATFPPKKILKSTSADPSNTSTEDYIVFNALSCYDSHSPSYFGVPMLVCVTIEESKNPELLYTRIVEQYQRYTTKNLFAPLEAVGRQAKHGLDDDITMDENAGHPAIRGLFNTKLYSTGYSANRNPLNVSLAEMAATKVFQARSINLAPLTHRAEKAAAEMKRAKLSVERDQKMQSENEEDKQSAVPSTLDEIESPDVELPQLSTFLAPPASPRVESNDTMVEGDGDTRQEPLPQVPLVHMGDVVLCEWSRDHADYVFETKAPSKMAMVLSTRVKDAEFDEMETGTEESVEPEQNPLEARLGREKGKSLFDSMEEMISPATLAQQAEDERRRVKGTSLIDCFDEFMQTEKLSDDNLWYCRKCKEHRRASKSMGFWKLPEVLIVQLKRFSQSRTLRDKIDIMVDFDVEYVNVAFQGKGLDLSSKVSGEKHEHNGGLIYDLHAVSNHYGGLGGGHYTAYAQNPEDGQWYHFDDSRVEKVSVDSIKTSAAYLLFYRRRENKNVPCGPVKMPVRAVEAESPTFSNRPTLRFSENRRPFENTPSYGRSIANDDDGIGKDVISTNPRTPTFPGEGRVLGFSSTVSREIPSVISASSFVPRSVMIPQSSLQSTNSPTSTSPSSPQSCTSSSSPGTPSSTTCASRSETPGRFDQLMINQSPSSPWVAVPSGSNSSLSSFETRFNTELSDVVFRDSPTTLDFDVGDDYAEPNGRRDHREERMPENNDMDE